MQCVNEKSCYFYRYGTERFGLEGTVLYCLCVLCVCVWGGGGGGNGECLAAEDGVLVLWCVQCHVSCVEQNELPRLTGTAG